MYKRKDGKLSYWLTIAGAAVLYAAMALSDNIWADEAYTFAMLRHSFSEIWAITAADVHPPLYYFLAKLFTMPFGYSQISVRLFSGLCYLLIVAIGGKEIQKYFDQTAGLLFMVLFTLYPFSLEHATEARMYPLAALAVFLCALFAYRAWRENRLRDWIGFALAGVCGAYTHYFALVSIAFLYGLLFLCCLIKKRALVKPWIIASLASVCLYLPWLKCFVEQLAFKVNNEYWIAPISASDLFQYALSVLHANGHSVFPLFFGLLMVFLVVFLAMRKDIVALLALLIPLLTLLLGIAVSLLVRPIFIIRYLVPCGPLLIFFVAYGMSRLGKDSLIHAATGVLVVSFAGNLLFALLDLVPTPNKFDMEFARKQGQAEACVVVSESNFHVGQVIAYYFASTPVYALETPDAAANPYENLNSVAEFTPEGLQSYLFVTDIGSGPDSSFTKDYDPVLLGTYHDVGNFVDVWLMTRR